MYKISVDERLAQWCNLDRYYETTRFETRQDANLHRLAMIADCADADRSTRRFAPQMITIEQDRGSTCPS